jgi:hypothetical protein
MLNLDLETYLPHLKMKLKNQDDSNCNSIHGTLMWRNGLWSQTLEVQVQIKGGVLLMASVMCYHISAYNNCCPHTHKSKYINIFKISIHLQIIGIQVQNI